MENINKHKIQELISSYDRNKREADRLRKILWRIYGPPTKMVAQYGIEATLPKPNTNIVSKYEMEDMEIKEQRQYERYEECAYIVDITERLVNTVKDKLHMNILEDMFSGISERTSATCLGVSRNKLRKEKDRMLDNLCKEYQNLHMIDRYDIMG